MIRVIAFVFSLIPLILFAQDVKSILSEMPENEKRILRELFFKIMNEEQGAYTLFGDKPVSLSGGYKRVAAPFQEAIKGKLFRNPFWQKWTVWKKYSHLFAGSNYLFIEEDSYILKNVKSLFFINKSVFLEVVDDNIDLFKEVLGNEITAVALLASIEEEHKFMQVLNKSEILLGVLLGYGKHNAILYDRSLTLTKFLHPSNFSELMKAPQSPSHEFSSAERELEILQKKLQSLNPYEDPIYLLDPIYCSADLDNEETKRLQVKYAISRNQISRYFADCEDFLELILAQLVN